MPRSTEEKIAILMEDMGDISSAASHELRDRLREALQHCGDLRGNATGSAAELAGHIERCIREVLGNADILRDYSFLIQNTEKPRPCDLGEIADAAMSACAPLIQEKHAAITRDALPTITGRPAQLRKLFEHLLQNGLLYNDSAKPNVHISAAERGGHWELCFADNGTGIDPEMELLVVGLFRRGVEEDSPIPGKGAGLAWARKAAQNHEGDLRIESTPGSGTKVFVTLMK